MRGIESLGVLPLSGAATRVVARSWIPTWKVEAEVRRCALAGEKTGWRLHLSQLVLVEVPSVGKLSERYVQLPLGRASKVGGGDSEATY